VTSFSIDFRPDEGLDGAIAAWQADADARWPATLARIQEQSRLSGLEVAYDLTMFGEKWSPIFNHDSDHPVAWSNNRTGERRDGATHPEAPLAPLEKGG
jgi:hypothetical protein